jgi:pyruvate dehydrogenase complex dehydrogenase (E1) component
LTVLGGGLEGNWRNGGVDVESTVVGTLFALAEKKLIDRKVVAQAIKDLGVDPEMVQPQIV